MDVTRPRNRRWEQVDKDSVELSTLARHFELHNRTEGKSPRTVEWYRLVLRLFQRFLIESEKPTNLGELWEPEVREFILYLQDKKKWQDNPCMPTRQTGIAAITIQTYIRALRAFFNWLYEEGYTTENRLAKLKPPKAPAKVVEVLTEQETARILGCISTKTANGARNYATGRSVFLTELEYYLRIWKKRIRIERTDDQEVTEIVALPTAILVACCSEL